MLGSSGFLEVFSDGRLLDVFPGVRGLLVFDEVAELLDLILEEGDVRGVRFRGRAEVGDLLLSVGVVVLEVAEDGPEILRGELRDGAHGVGVLEVPPPEC